MKIDRADMLQGRAIEIWSQAVAVHGLVRTLHEEEQGQLDELANFDTWGTRLQAAENMLREMAEQLGKHCRDLDPFLGVGGKLEGALEQDGGMCGGGAK